MSPQHNDDARMQQKYRKQQAERGGGGKLNEKSLSRSLSSSGEEYLTLGDLSPVFISDLSLAQVGMTPLQVTQRRRFGWVRLNG